MRSQLSASKWLIEEIGFDINKANLFETLFTVGNGFLGTRGTLEEGFQGELSGTYLNGVFDAHDSPVIDLVNAPDWLSFVVFAEGVRLDVQSCKIVSHQRALDIKQGALWRETIFEHGKGRRTKVETLRFASYADQNLCALRVAVTPLNHNATITTESAIEGRRYNLERHPAYIGTPDFPPEVKWEKWAKSKHLQQVKIAAGADGLYMEMQTIDTAISIGYAATVIPSITPLRNTIQECYERVAERLEFELGRGQTLIADKFVTIQTSRNIEAVQIENFCHSRLMHHSAEGFDAAFASNRGVWLNKWKDCDVVVEGDDAATQAARFNIYHLLIAANENDPRVNIGAKSLSGEGYRGHVFWDTEIFMLPFYIYTQPATAKALLMYRYHTMVGARENAKLNGFNGAQFAWESADTGLETTPKWTADGQHRIWTGEEEIHVTADVAYGVLTYVTATGDMEFLNDYGAEILFETSRFWIDRLEYDAIHDQYTLTRVIGPDEFHEHVDNNAYTNRMVKWHLAQAARIHDELAMNYPKALAKLSSKIMLKPNEFATWRSVASRILIPFDVESGLIEQFHGYFLLKEVPITQWDSQNMPCYPEDYNHFNSGETTLLKQPDVVMLMYVLPDEFSDDVKRSNYDYYESRTMHKSSLSPAIHSIMGIEVGDTARALQYFRRSAFVDLMNNQGNTQDGIHAASAAGTWQTLVFGFGGFRIMHGQMNFKPWLPPEWQELRFCLQWRGSRLAVNIRHADISFVYTAAPGIEETIIVAGQVVTLKAGEKTTVSMSTATGK